MKKVIYIYIYIIKRLSQPAPPGIAPLGAIRKNHSLDGQRRARQGRCREVCQEIGSQPHVYSPLPRGEGCQRCPADGRHRYAGVCRRGGVAPARPNRHLSGFAKGRFERTPGTGPVLGDGDSEPSAVYAADQRIP